MGKRTIVSFKKTLLRNGRLARPQPGVCVPPLKYEVSSKEEHAVQPVHHQSRTAHGCSTKKKRRWILLVLIMRVDQPLRRPSRDEEKMPALVAPAFARWFILSGDVLLHNNVWSEDPSDTKSVVHLSPVYVRAADMLIFFLVHGACYHIAGCLTTKRCMASFTAVMHARTSVN